MPVVKCQHYATVAPPIHSFTLPPVLTTLLLVAQQHCLILEDSVRWLLHSHTHNVLAVSTYHSREQS